MDKVRSCLALPPTYIKLSVFKNFVFDHGFILSFRSAAALMMGDEFHKFGRCRPDRNDFLGFGNSNSSSRQIYLTFPADSTFKEEDVSNYFRSHFINKQS